jgi:hypothetical protein
MYIKVEYKGSFPKVTECNDLPEMTAHIDMMFPIDGKNGDYLELHSK